MYKIGSIVYTNHLYYIIVKNTERLNYYIVSTTLGMQNEMYLPSKPGCKGPYIFEPTDEYYDFVLEEFRERIKFNLEEVNLEYISKFANTIHKIYE